MQAHFLMGRNIDKKGSNACAKFLKCAVFD
jgi:hypothetical protein